MVPKAARYTYKEAKYYICTILKLLFCSSVSETARAPLYISESSSSLNAAFHFNRKLISPATPVKTFFFSFSVCQTDANMTSAL